MATSSKPTLSRSHSSQTDLLKRSPLVWPQVPQAVYDHPVVIGDWVHLLNDCPYEPVYPERSHVLASQVSLKLKGDLRRLSDDSDL
jgi:hypothetical protein